MKPLAVLLIVLTAAVCANAAKTTERVIDPVARAQVEATFILNGVSYKLYDGKIYRVNKQTGKWQFVAQGYDPDYCKKNYVERHGLVFRKTDNGTLYEVKRFLSEDFENTETILDLINIKRGWTSMTLQSPTTPTIKDYVRLRQSILKGKSSFLDNYIALTSQIVHSGQHALKTYSVAKSPNMVTAKASLDTELLHFVKGDDVWFSAWYFIPENSGMPTTIMDLETTWFRGQPGIRIFLFGNKYAGFELKWGAKPKYRQKRGHEIAFPIAKWVHLKYHLRLSEKQDGVIQLWQDGHKIVDTFGQTLPLAHTIYNSLEIGLTAYSTGPQAACLYVDDMTISARPIDTVRVQRQPSP